MLGFQGSDLLGGDDIKSILWDDGPEVSFENLSSGMFPGGGNRAVPESSSAAQGPRETRLLGSGKATPPRLRS